MKSIYLLLLLLFTHSIAIAFSCYWKGPFFDIIQSQDIVAKVKVIGHEKDSMGHTNILVAEVLKIYKGQVKSTTIRCFGNGNWEKASASDFSKDKLYFMLFNYPKNTPYFELMACGEYQIEIKKDKTISLKNSIFDSYHTQAMTIIQFEEEIKQAVQGCLNINFDPYHNLTNTYPSTPCTPKKKRASTWLWLIPLMIMTTIGITIKLWKNKSSHP